MGEVSRRAALIGSLAIGAAVAFPAVGRAAPAGRFAELEARHNALIGVYAANLDSGRVIEERADESFAMCSTFKAYLAGRVLQLVERGQLTLEQRIFVDSRSIIMNSPVTKLHSGDFMTVAELCQAILQVSDNAAANLLLARVDGPAGITAFARSIGDERSRLDRWETDLNAAAPGDPRDTSSPRALAGGFRELLTGEVLSVQRRRLLEDWMRANQTSSMRAGLPAGWASADKTGSGDYGSTNDVGIAFGPAGERLLLAILIRSAGADPKAEGFRPLVGEVTGQLVPQLI
ncbi:class A beta-lactamase [Mycolicibacterium brumae]|uniref:Beta-lactamase n=1 Tax=Mycolicibacterium brumae TaxID=85968 RepID=A0A2G5P4C1_9MYCO|nr:class A beta-lactamase [Mycolicibacterium brumae]MCV7194853.1 class A beta-lactamase [Mycolicibacterium brumae]PIB73241.1 class A beta-lactamase [Mycolicibacterium brumae]RWA17888.1 hypothetical protein MBRU_18360 [Mycolicibacterium brumae DSM 44177]UWW09305.1 class A beta-lactamase [Mycolicibacterium brumae]